VRPDEESSQNQKEENVRVITRENARFWHRHFLYAAPPARTTAAVYFPAKYPQLVWRHFRIPTCVCAQVGGRLCSREFLVFVLRAAANVLAVCVS